MCFKSILINHEITSDTSQGRPLADWTDCCQSGPAPKGAPRYAYELTLLIESVCVVLARAPQYVLSVRSVENHRKQK